MLSDVGEHKPAFKVLLAYIVSSRPSKRTLLRSAHPWLKAALPFSYDSKYLIHLWTLPLVWLI